jgi:hypothetical protein
VSMISILAMGSSSRAGSVAVLLTAGPAST